MCSIILEHSDKDLNENLKEMPDDRITWSKKEWLRVHPLSNLIFWHSDQFNKTQSHARIRDFNQLAGRIFEILLAVLSRIIRVGYARSWPHRSVCWATQTLMSKFKIELDIGMLDHCIAGDLKLVKIFGCWWLNCNVGDIFWMLMPDNYVKR